MATPAQRRADDEASQALLAQLEELRAAWHNLHRQLTLPTEQPQPTRSLTFFDEEAGRATRHGALLTSQQRQLFALEAQITDLWRQLQIHRTVTPPVIGAPTLPLPFGAMAATTPAYDRRALPG